MAKRTPSRAWTDEEARKFTAPCADRHQWDAWLAAHDARVRRDAAREALDGLRERAGRRHRVGMTTAARDRWADIYNAATDYRDTRYPEEDTP